jgi:hypothetical protein
MSRALLAFNPEAHGIGGDRLLFGVAAPIPPRPSGLSALEELNLATQFLEAQSEIETVALLRSIIRRSGTSRERTIDPQVLGPLLKRLARSAAIVRNALLSSEAETGSPISPEGIFGTELEGLSPEDREFETALRFVRMASEMARIATRSPAGVAPDIIASRAEHLVTRRLAPGLSRALLRSPPGFRARRRARLGQ